MNAFPDRNNGWAGDLVPGVWMRKDAEIMREVSNWSFDLNFRFDDCSGLNFRFDDYSDDNHTDR